MPFPVWLPSKKNPTFPNMIFNKNACMTDHLFSITLGIVLRLVAEKMNLQEKNPFFSTIFSFQREGLNPALSRVEKEPFCGFWKQWENHSFSGSLRKLLNGFYVRK